MYFLQIYIRRIKMSTENLQNEMYRTAAMGTSSIKQVLPSVHDSTMRKELAKQMCNYHNESNAVVSEMRQSHVQPKNLPMSARMMTKAGIALNLAKDSSTQHIAEMMIQGTNMGIINLNKAINSAKTAPKNTLKQAEEMLSREQRYIDSLKKYL